MKCMDTEEAGSDTEEADINGREQLLHQQATDTWVHAGADGGLMPSIKTQAAGSFTPQSFTAGEARLRLPRPLRVT